MVIMGWAPGCPCVVCWKLLSPSLVSSSNNRGSSYDAIQSKRGIHTQLRILHKGTLGLLCFCEITESQEPGTSTQVTKIERKRNVCLSNLSTQAPAQSSGRIVFVFSAAEKNLGWKPQGEKGGPHKKDDSVTKIYMQSVWVWSSDRKRFAFPEPGML